jgi:hypothetical protein
MVKPFDRRKGRPQRNATADKTRIDKRNSTQLLRVAWDEHRIFEDNDGYP